MEKRLELRHRIGGGDRQPPSNPFRQQRRQIAGLYDLEETLGEGHYAVVKLARHVFTGEKVAVKVIDKSKLDAATRVQMLQEVQLMKLVQHPHVVRLYEVIDTETKLYLVLEFADGGDMYDYIMRHEGGLDEDQAKKYFRQIVTAIQYCHRLHVVHRDLKPENVVFFEKLGIVKLTDFGFSNQFNPGQRLETSCGSLAYSAPEILLGDAYDAPAVDIWSLGVILYMLVCGTAPFQEANDSETLTKIMDCKYSFPKHISQHCKRLISRMLQRQPELRASLADIVSDPWFGGAADSEGNAMSTEEQLPMVSREHLTEDEHEYILAKMVTGEIAEKEEIIEALDMNEYNHITATYFLLAERKLGAQRHAMARQLRTRRSRRVVSTSSMASREQKQDKPVSACKSLEEGGLGATERLVEISGGLPPSLAACQRPSAIVESLLSPDAPPVGAATAAAAAAAAASSNGNKRFAAANRLRNISIVQEEDEEEENEEVEESLFDENDTDVVVSTLVTTSHKFSASRSRHSSTSSIAEKVAAIATAAANAGSATSTTIVDISSLAASLRSFQQQSTGANSSSSSSPTPPAPFPVSSQIGTGGLSRQGSLRKAASVDTGSNVAAATGAASASSTPSTQYPTVPALERKDSNVSSASTSSNGSSPARCYKVGRTGKKLVATRSSPQLVLNQIHEEAEDVSTSGSGAAPTQSPTGRRPSFAESHQHQVQHQQQQEVEDPVDSFPSSAAGVAVIRRLEQRRRLHKARAQSCSSSDASDDDSESRRRRNERRATPPYGKRDSQHEDSSDSQDPGVGNASSLMTSGSLGGGRTVVTKTDSHNNNNANSESNAGGGGGSSSGGSRRTRTAHTSSTRLRQSHSLNRISELHIVADFNASDQDANNNSGSNAGGANTSCASSVVSGSANAIHHHKPPPPPQLLESDTEGAPFDMLTRYLESLSAYRGGGGSNSRSRDDSQNSSDGELDGEISSRPSSASRRHKVNLRVLEQRLNKIQEENNRSADEEEGEVEDDDDDGEISDDPSTLPDEADALNAKSIEIYDPKRFAWHLEQQQPPPADSKPLKRSRGSEDETRSCFGRVCTSSSRERRLSSGGGGGGLTAAAAMSAAATVGHHPRRPLHRAHSCGSLMALKAARNFAPAALWLDLLRRREEEELLQLATAPITNAMLQMQQNPSRCCNLY